MSDGSSLVFVFVVPSMLAACQLPGTWLHTGSGLDPHIVDLAGSTHDMGQIWIHMHMDPGWIHIQAGSRLDPVIT